MHKAEGSISTKLNLFENDITSKGGTRTCSAFHDKADHV